MRSEGVVRITRVADEASLGAIQRLRYDVYVMEQGKQYVEANHESRSFADPVDPVSTHFAAHYDGRLVGAVRYTDADWLAPHLLAESRAIRSIVEGLAGSELSFTSRLVLDRRHRRSARCLEPMLVAVFEHACVSGCIANVIHTQVNLQRFFEKLGYRKAGDQPF